VAQLGARFHGMEEVAGSIPARSTNILNDLDRANTGDRGVCVLVCVMTRFLILIGKASVSVCFASIPTWVYRSNVAKADVSDVTDQANSKRRKELGCDDESFSRWRES
jgi:hypothetical protein